MDPTRFKIISLLPFYVSSCTQKKVKLNGNIFDFINLIELHAACPISSRHTQSHTCLRPDSFSNNNSSSTMADNTKTLARAAMAEFFAMTLFVWCGCGTAVTSQAVHGFDAQSLPEKNAFIATVSLAFGLAISVLAYSIAPISGGHINPAVTMAFVVSGKMPIVTGLVYVAAQCLGAILGAALVWGTVVNSLSEGKVPLK